MLGLYVYEYDGAAGFWDLQIAETQWIDEGYSSENIHLMEIIYG